MGRQKGDGARSKTRASSSSGAAALLQGATGTGGAIPVGFGGFMGSSRVEDLQPQQQTQGPSDTLETTLLLDVDGEVAVHIRRLSKRDTTTKLKALAALRAVFQEKPAAELTALLPSWIFVYRRLAVSGSRQVREASHQAMGDIARAVGRSLAPHLKSVIGTWWVSQFDPFKEVAEAARVSFLSVFATQKKKLEALTFCREDIFAHLDENLRSSPQTVADKALPPEEASECHERVISSSLLALANLLDVLLGVPEVAAKRPSPRGGYVQSEVSAGPKRGRLTGGREGVAEAEGSEASVSGRDEGEGDGKERVEGQGEKASLFADSVVRICTAHHCFRDFLKSKSPIVRSAVYQALRVLCERVPSALEADLEAVAPIVLGTFKEEDPSCHSTMWDLVIWFSRTFPQAWRSGQVRKAALPRLWSFLRHACHGSPQTSYPSLVVLLSVAPPDILSPGQDFRLQFLRNLYQGRTACGSEQDRQALLTALKECLLYSLLHVSSSGGESFGADLPSARQALVDGILVSMCWADYISHGQPSTWRHLSLSETSLSGHNHPTSDAVQSPAEPSGGPVAAGKPPAATGSLAVVMDEGWYSALGITVADIVCVLAGKEGGAEALEGFWSAVIFDVDSVARGDGARSGGREEGGEMASVIERVAAFVEMVAGRCAALGRGNGVAVERFAKGLAAAVFPLIEHLAYLPAVRLLTRLVTNFGLVCLADLSRSHIQHPPGTHVKLTLHRPSHIPSPSPRPSPPTSNPPSATQTTTSAPESATSAPENVTSALPSSRTPTSTSAEAERSEGDRPHIRQFTREALIPLCLGGQATSIPRAPEQDLALSSHIDLLLSVLKHEAMLSEWDSAVCYITGWVSTPGLLEVEMPLWFQGATLLDGIVREVSVLAVLLERLSAVMEEAGGTGAAHLWRSEKLDAAVLAVAWGELLERDCGVRVLRAALTNPGADSLPLLLSPAAATSALSVLSRRISSALSTWPAPWAAVCAARLTAAEDGAHGASLEAACSAVRLAASVVATWGCIPDADEARDVAVRLVVLIFTLRWVGMEAHAGSETRRRETAKRESSEGSVSAVLEDYEGESSEEEGESESETEDLEIVDKTRDLVVDGGDSMDSPPPLERFQILLPTTTINLLLRKPPKSRSKTLSVTPVI